MLHMIAPMVPAHVRQWGHTKFEEATRVLDRARVWTWHLVHLESDLPVRVAWLGRKGHAHALADLLGVPLKLGERRSLREGLLATEAPMPGALRVPLQLRTVIALDRPLESIMQRWDSELRRKVRKLQSKHRWELVTDDDEIDRIHHEMLVPFTDARHAEHGKQVPLAAVRRMAKAGGLHRLACEGECIGAHLGYDYVHRGVRHFTTLRFGYPREIFSDAKKLGEANTINLHLALEHSISMGARAYDIGPSLARPDGGLLQFKRRRHAALASHDIDVVWFRLPSERAPELLSVAPIFALEGDAIDLHVGVTRETDDATLVSRFREWRFLGLRAVKIHAARPIEEGTRRALAALYEERGNPEIEIL